MRKFISNTSLILTTFALGSAAACSDEPAQRSPATSRTTNPTTSPSAAPTLPPLPTVSVCEYLDLKFVGHQLDASKTTEHKSGASTRICKMRGPKGSFTLTVARDAEGKKLYDGTTPTKLNLPTDGFHTTALTPKPGAGVVATWKDGRVFRAQFEDNATRAVQLPFVLRDISNRLNSTVR